MLATGTSCLARVWVIGRRRVPAPPARISAFIRTRSVGLVDGCPSAVAVGRRRRAAAAPARRRGSSRGSAVASSSSEVERGLVAVLGAARPAARTSCSPSSAAAAHRAGGLGRRRGPASTVTDASPRPRAGRRATNGSLFTRRSSPSTAVRMNSCWRSIRPRSAVSSRLPVAVDPLLVVAAAGVGERHATPSSVWQPGLRSSPECGVLGRRIDADLDAADLRRRGA